MTLGHALEVSMGPPGDVGYSPGEGNRHIINMGADE